MQSCLIIDGYNALNKIKIFESKKDINLEAARLYLIRKLLDFLTCKKTFDKVFIVFDSKIQDSSMKRHSYGKIEVIFSEARKDADTTIVDMLRDLGPGYKISVSSDDNFIKNHAKVYGATIISVRELENLIMLKKKSSSSKINEKDLDESLVKDINEELRRYWRLK